MRNRPSRKSPEQWKSLIEKFHNHNELTQQQFCDAEKLALGTFQKWLYKFAEQDRGTAVPAATPTTPGSTTPAFGPVTIKSTSVLPSGCCMELPCNVLLHTQSLPSVEYLENLVKVFGHER